MERVVTVSAPAHLHAGNIDMNGGLGRLYGTLGFTVSQPRLVVEARAAPETRVEGGPGWARAALASILEELRSEYGLPAVEARIRSVIPRGVGMGFTTAAVLAAATLYNTLYDAGIPLEDAALALGRSTVSALGFYSFTRGGMLLDGGFPREAKGYAIPPLLARYELPARWRFVIVLPAAAVPRVREFKEREEEVLETMPPMPEEEAARLSRLLLMKLLPAAAERNLSTLLEALTEFNSRLGEGYWSTRQGGVYCCSLVEEGAALLRRLAGGVAQSSWGPAFYTIAPGPGEARRIADEMRSWLNKHGGGAVYVAAPDNRGAVTRTH